MLDRDTLRRIDRRTLAEERIPLARTAVACADCRRAVPPADAFLDHRTGEWFCADAEACAAALRACSEAGLSEGAPHWLEGLARSPALAL